MRRRVDHHDAACFARSRATIKIHDLIPMDYPLPLARNQSSAQNLIVLRVDAAPNRPSGLEAVTAA